MSLFYRGKNRHREAKRLICEPWHLPQSLQWFSNYIVQITLVLRVLLYFQMYFKKSFKNFNKGSGEIDGLVVEYSLLFHKTLI